MLLDVDLQRKKCHGEKKYEIQQYYCTCSILQNTCQIQTAVLFKYLLARLLRCICRIVILREKNAKFNAGNNFNVNRFRKLHRGREFNSYLSIE